jgi:hypothetical protein
MATDRDLHRLATTRISLGVHSDWAFEVRVVLAAALIYIAAFALYIARFG